MGLEKLKTDWETDPQLSYLAFEKVEELAAHLRSLHTSMMGGELGCLGYLYRRQTLRNRQLTKELQNGRRK